MSEFTELLDRLRKALADNESVVRRLKTAISAMEKAQEVLSDDALDRLVSAEAPRQRVAAIPDQGPSLSPGEVAEEAQAVLLERGHPMKRGALVAALRERGIPLAGTDKSKNLGTILWRHPELFVNIPKLGYWVRGVRLPGIYDPSAPEST